MEELSDNLASLFVEGAPSAEEGSGSAQPTNDISFFLPARRDTPVPYRSSRTLLILDLNGVLIHRIRSARSAKTSEHEVLPEGAIRLRNFFVWKRPGLNEFLEMVFRHFDVAVWSSVRQENIGDLVDEVFGNWKGDLVFVWDQRKCGNFADPKARNGRHFLKNLSDVWRSYPMYDEVNTLIVDDSESKMKNNPEGCVMLATPWNRQSGRGHLDIGRDIMRSLAYRILFPPVETPRVLDR